MNPQPLPQSPAYREVVQGLLRMHRYTIEGQEDSDEADALREAMDEPWHRLSTVERDRIAGLSKDLYAITDPPEQPVPQPNSQGQRKIGEAYEAFQQGAWDRALELLRRWSASLPAPQLSYLRGRIWEEAGDPQVAVVFFEHACNLEPENEYFKATHLRALNWTDSVRARTIADAVLNESEKHDPNLVLQAADALFGVTRAMSEHAAAPIYRRLIAVLTPLLTRTKDEDGLERPEQVRMILALLAMCHRWLGETRAAYEYYSRAIVLDPLNAALLVARGILAYGTNPSAITDFEQAIKLNTQIVWPYYFLAHYLLLNNRMEECRVMCERALEKQAPPRVQSELLEFLGIALTSLDYPSEVARRAFENAIRVDPSNERAKQNLQRLLVALAAKGSRLIEWDRPSDSYVRSSGQQQIRSGLAVYAQREPTLS